MTDNLRDRIIEILKDAFAEMGVLNLGSVADVLIREIPELSGDCYSWCRLDAGHEGDCW